MATPRARESSASTVWTITETLVRSLTRHSECVADLGPRRTVHPPRGINTFSRDAISSVGKPERKRGALEPRTPVCAQLSNKPRNLIREASIAQLTTNHGSRS